MFDLIVFVEELRRRIVGRWRSFGLFSEDSQKTVERGLSNGFFIASTAQIPICA
ncbi:hypothetical protein MUU53_16110 [Rhizobium lemnae]|uniref:Uncharacterized protein n=1 Tax=Rhizobium lemnae TaxID=1214924 RepID=A0ABV8E503_9HYPH|nr:hypothetical protein [Rhizobium lemnae]MCJ8509437.1 hypothetical protein [Rhizobium lemnae]